MRFSARTWSLLSLLLFVAAAFFWLKGNEYEARKRLAPPVSVSTNSKSAAIDLFSTKSVSAQLASLNSGSQPITAAGIKNGQVEQEAIKKKFPYRLRNTDKTINELAKDDNAVLLANAFLDTTGELPEIPRHLQAEDDPGSYIVQWTGPADAQFRSRLSEAGAKIISYVPNNAYFVKVDKAGADQLTATPGVQSVLPYQPYYKLDHALLRLAVEQEPLPNGAFLRVTLFPGNKGAAQEMAALGVRVLAEENSPFGPQLLVSPPVDALVPLARLASVQGIERSGMRMPASDLSRIALGVAPNGSTNANYLGLTGEGVVVNINDSGIQPDHPALVDTTILLPSEPLASLITTNDDPDGHGTFVASLIAGSGAETPSTFITNSVPGTNGTTNVTVTVVLPGSETNASLRGIAPSSRLLALPLDPSGQQHADVMPRLLDNWLIESAARTNYQVLARTNTLISNNSWTYGIPTYDTSAARFDQAVRDALPGAPNDQPLLFVFAAGNSGDGESDGLGGAFDSIESPGTAKNVITVGALESPRFITNVFFTTPLTNFSTNTDNTIETNITIETNYPFAAVTDSDDEVAEFSSRGNVGIGLEGDFGRFKPDVVAPGTMLIAARSAGWNFNGFDTNDSEFGELFFNLHTNLQPYRYDSGSTFAAANISGTLALIQEYFQSKAPSAAQGPLSPALMKALLINGARSLGRNYDIAMQAAANYQGWGLANLPNSLSSYTTNTHASVEESKMRLRAIEQSAGNAVATGQSRTWNVTLSTNSVSFPLRVTLVWTDPPGNPAVAVKLVNDLDLIVTNLDTGLVYAGNFIPFGSDTTEPVEPEAGDIVTTDFINNVEQVTVRDPSLLGREFSITVRGHRVNVNAIPDYLARTGNSNDVVQDYALVISSEIGADPELNDPDPTNPNGYLPNLEVFEKFERVAQINTEPRAPLTTITNGLPLLTERVGANPTQVGTNGVVGQWNFYVFTNVNTTNDLVTTRAGSNVAFVTFNSPNLSRPRAVEADIDVYVSKNPALTNLNPAAISTAFKAFERGGTESVVFTNAVIGDIYYVGVKAEDQQAAEFSLIGVSSDLPFEEEQNGRIILRGVPIEAAVLDGNPRRPTAGTMIAIGLSSRRVANAQATVTTFHENFPDLVGVLSKNQTRVILNNHSFLGPDQNFGTNTFTYVDNSQFAIPGVSQPSDGPGNLNEFVGYKIVGPWFFEMIDNSPSHTGRVRRLEIVIDPLQDDIIIGETITETVEAGQTLFFPLDVPPGATNLNFLFELTGGPLEFYWREGLLPTTNLFDFRTNLVAPGINFDIPVIGGRTYYMGIRNPTASDVTFTLTVTADFADASFNRFFREGSLDRVLDTATTNEVIDVDTDKLVADIRVGIRMKHPRTSDIALSLISPQGSRLLLAENRGYTNIFGFGSTTIITNRSTNGMTVVSNIPNYLIFTDDTNATIPVKFANPGGRVTLGALGVAFASGFEGSVLAGNYRPGTSLAGGWVVTQGNPTNPVTAQMSIINGPGLAHTGDTLASLGTAGVRRQIRVTPGLSHTLRFAARRGKVMDFYSTGVDDTRVATAPGLQDLHYQLLNGSQTEFFGPAAFVLHTNESPFLPPSSWTTNSLTSQWIAPYNRVPSTNGMGQYVFRTYLNLYEMNPQIVFPVFRWSGDDAGSFVRLNGIVLPYAGGSPSNFFAGPTYTLGGLRNGLNILDFFVDDTNGAEGLRVDVLSPINPAKNPNPTVTVTVGGVRRTIPVSADWTMQAIQFTPSAANETLIFENGAGEVWLDSVSVEERPNLFVQPEEPFELLEGERAMGEWRIEVRDTRTGAVLPTTEMLDWNLELTFADTRNTALRMQAGDISPRIRLETNQVLWVVLDPCQGATFARLVLQGFGNFDALELFADLNGFPTGNPELDDFIPISNDQNPGQANGRLTFEISTLLPAPARLTGKPIFVGIINRFQNATNEFELDFMSDGTCSPSTPPPVLAPDTPATGSVDPNTGGTNSNQGVFQFTVPPNARAATVTVVSDGDVTVYALKDTPPTTSTYSHTINSIAGAGTETLRLDPSSIPPLSPGLWFVRVSNNTGQRVNFTITVTFEFSGPGGSIFVQLIRDSLGGYQLIWNSEIGKTYVVEASPSLVPANWTTVTTRIATSTLETYIPSVDLTKTHEFFRIRQL